MKTILQHKLNLKKSPGYDLITGKVLMELPDKCVLFITIVFNAILSLLPILSKVLEKLILKRLQLTLQQNALIPNHQFGFRRHHATVEQIHRVVSQVSEDLEEHRYCSAALLDISQAFDKVWHTRLLYKLKTVFPITFSCFCDHTLQASPS